VWRSNTSLERTRGR